MPVRFRMRSLFLAMIAASFVASFWTYQDSSWIVNSLVIVLLTNVVMVITVLASVLAESWRSPDQQADHR